MNDDAFIKTLLKNLGISSQTIGHEALFSAESMARIDLSQWEYPVKNFFMYDKKKQFFLITTHIHTPPVDFKALRPYIGAQGSLSFAKEADLAEKLKVYPGSVTPYAAAYDTQKTITIVLDKTLQAAETISAHPLRNDETTTIRTADLLKLYTHTGHEPLWVNMPLRA